MFSVTTFYICRFLGWCRNSIQTRGCGVSDSSNLTLCDHSEVAHTHTHTTKPALMSYHDINEFLKYLWEHLFYYRCSRLKTYSCNTYLFFWNVIIICSIAPGIRKSSPPRLRRTSFVHPPPNLRDGGGWVFGMWSTRSRKLNIHRNIFRTCICYNNTKQQENSQECWNIVTIMRNNSRTSTTKYSKKNTVRNGCQ